MKFYVVIKRSIIAVKANFCSWSDISAHAMDQFSASLALHLEDVSHPSDVCVAYTKELLMAAYLGYVTAYNICTRIHSKSVTSLVISMKCHYYFVTLFEEGEMIAII